MWRLSFPVRWVMVAVVWAAVWATLCGAGFAVAQALQEVVPFLGTQAWGTEEGLPQSSVHAVAQTKDGYIWAATEGGLARFDGVGFAVFGRANEGAFRSDDLCCLVADAAGLWVGSSDGVVRIEGGRFRRYGVEDGLANELVLSLHEGAQGLVVETTGGWSRWDGQRFVAADAGEAAWRVEGGVLSVRGVARTWSVGKDLPAGRVTSVLVDRVGLVWVGMSRSADGRGLVVADAASGAVQSVGALQGSGVLAIFEDAEGNHWVGTETTGLHVLRRLPFRSEAALAGIAVTAVAETADGEMWVGTREDGLRRLRDGVWQPVAARDLTSAVVLCLAAGAKGGLWVGTPDGLNLVSGDGKTVRQITSADGLPEDAVRSLAAGLDGSVWVGTRRGLVHVRVDAGGVSMKVLTSADGLGGELIGTMLMDAKGELWVATAQGVSRVRSDGAVASFGVPGGIVKAIAEEGGAVWVATEDGGVSRFDGRGFARLAEVGSGENGVVAMLGDGRGALWVRMERGVRRLAVASLRGGVAEPFASYGLADGMPNSEVVPEGSSLPWLAADGAMWFPTRGGVAVADTAHLALNAVPPPVTIERLLVDDVPRVVGGTLIEIPAGRSRLTVEYAGMSFVVPGAVRYRYRLDGFDERWIEAGTRRSATYTNLPPGTYTFRVMASNNDGVWSTGAAEMKIRVVPPFYRRWWFVALCVLALGAMLAGLYLLRLHRLRREFDAVLAERNRMAREIHDTLTQDFVGTSLQLDIVAQHLKSGKIDTAMEDVRRTRRLVTEGLEEARRSIWELRANESQDSLPQRVRNLLERDRYASVAPQLKVGGAYRVLEARVEREVLRIAQEALVNVVQHAQATAAWVELIYEREVLVLAVRDNGRGFSVDEAAQREGHFGLVGMRERAAAIGGTLEIVSEVGDGTTVTLSVALESSSKVGGASPRG